MKRILVVALLILSSLGITGCGSYDWHQKLTVEVETPDGVKSGSAVTSVSWWKNEFFKDGAAYQTKYQGEAVVVDLGSGRYLFALLRPPRDDEEYIANLATRALYDTKERTWGDEAFKRVMVTKDLIKVPEIVYPLLVTFADISDPKSVQKVDAANLAASFGAGYKIKSITLEITSEEVTAGKVEELLGWLKQVGIDRPTLIPNPPPDRSTASNPDIQYLSPGEFSTELYK